MTRKLPTVTVTWCLLALLNATVAYSQQHVGYGDIVSGTISVSGEVDVYTFDGVAGEQALLRMSETGGGGPFVPTLEVFDCAGSSVLRQGHDWQVEMRLTLPCTGTYTVLASDNDVHPGSYTLFLQRIVNPVGAPVISYSDILGSEQIAPVGWMQAYTFDGVAGEQALLRMSETGGGGPFVPTLEVFDCAGQAVLRQGHDWQVEMRLTLPCTGTYTVLASDNDVHPGSYTLFLQRIVNPVGAPVISYSDILATEQITPVGLMRAYTFDGVAGEQALLRMSETGGGGPFVPTLEVFDCAGSSVLRQGHDWQVEMRLTLPCTGTYTVLASDNDVHPGNYTLFLQRLRNPVGATAISYSDILANEQITPVGWIQAYTFDGVAGEQALLRMSETGGGGPFVPTLEVFDCAGSSVLRQGHDWQVEMRLTLPCSGTYTVLAADNDVHPGSYTLFLQRIVNPVNAAVISYGDSLTNQQITPVGLMRAYVFGGSAGEQALLRMWETGGGGPFVPTLEIFDPHGASLQKVSHDTQAGIQVTLPGSGTYTVLARDNDVHPGNYTLVLLRTGGTSPLTLKLKKVFINQTGKGVAKLRWNPLTVSTAKVDIYVDGVFLQKTANDGKVKVKFAHPAGGPFAVHICERRSTTVCSNTVVVDFTGTPVEGEVPDDFDDPEEDIVYEGRSDDNGARDGAFGGRHGEEAGRQTAAQMGEPLPETFVLHGNYPNPFNPTTTLTFDLPEQAEVSVEVVDLLGRLVMLLPARTMEAGASRTLDVDATPLASGTYLYRLVARTQDAVHVKTGRMMLVK